jgi:uncharacterized protein (TIGR03086 family)
MDGMDALDAAGVRLVELVGQVGPEQWGNPTPCTEWTVRTLVGHLIAGTQGYCELLKGAPAARLRSMLERQSEAVGTDPVAALQSAVRALRAAFAEPGALQRTVHHRVDIPGSELLVLWTSDAVVHSWDLATAIGVEPALPEQLVEFVYGTVAPRVQLYYTSGWFAAPTRRLPEDATPLDRLTHLVGR